MEKWYEMASKLDNQRRRLAMILQGQGPQVSRRVQERDPDAMDIDRLSRDQVDKYRREGRCFNCGMKNHMARECQRRNNRRNAQSGRFERRNIRQTEPYDDIPTDSPQTRVQRAQVLMRSMTDSERAELVGSLEQSGF